MFVLTFKRLTKDVPLLKLKSNLLFLLTALLFVCVPIEFLLGRGQFSKAGFHRGDFLGGNFSWVVFLGGEYSGDILTELKKRLKIPQKIVLLENIAVKMLDF